MPKTKANNPRISLKQANRFFDEDSLSVLSNTGRWRFISPFTETERKTPARAKSFRRWMKLYHHRHPFHEVLLVAKGSSLYGIDHTVFRCRPGTMVIIAPNQLHAYKYLPGDNHLYHVWVSFITPGQALVQFVFVEEGRMRRLQDERCLISVDSLSRLLHLLHDIKTGNAPTKPAQAYLLLHAFFADLINRLIESGYHPTGLIDRELIQRKKIAMICANIRENGAFNSSLAILASVAGYSPGHFARLFKQITGHTFHQHVDTCRIERVKELLAERTPYKVMANTLGFTCKSTFSRWLNKYRRYLQS